MTILFDATRLAKPSRKFGAKILAYVPYTGTVGYSASDDAWLAAQNANPVTTDPGPIGPLEAAYLETRARTAGELVE